MNKSSNSRKINRITYTGMLFATALVLSVVESMLPVLPTMPPGVKLGLSNIVTMYAMFTLGFRGGLTIAVLKAGFVFLTRGMVASSLSLVGGLTSITVMVLFSKLPGVKNNYLLLSILGAVGHNIGQLIVAIFITQTPQFVYMLPLLFVSAVGMGFVTGLVLKTVMPYVRKLNIDI